MEDKSKKERANSRNSTQVRESKKMVMDGGVDLSASLLTRLAPQKAASSSNCRDHINSSIDDRLPFVVSYVHIYELSFI